MKARRTWSGVITLGIDLAAEPMGTGGCAIEWRDGAAAVRWLSTGLHDDEILRLAREADVVGIDAPFGWPTYFVDAITAHHAGRRWPVDAWEKVSRRRLRLRVTDERVHRVTGITPLSVSSDAIAGARDDREPRTSVLKRLIEGLAVLYRRQLGDERRGSSAPSPSRRSGGQRCSPCHRQCAEP